MGVTLAPPGEYDWTLHVQQWCGLFVKLLWPHAQFLFNRPSFTVLPRPDRVLWKKAFWITAAGFLRAGCTSCHQPTVSKNWRKLKALIPTTEHHPLATSFLHPPTDYPVISCFSFTICFAIRKISFWCSGSFRSLAHSFCFFSFAEEITLFALCLHFLYSIHVSLCKSILTSAQIQNSLQGQNNHSYKTANIILLRSLKVLYPYYNEAW